MNTLQIFGVLALVHAAYSSYEWVRVHKLLGQQATPRVPRDVVVETLVGLVLCVLASVASAYARVGPEYVATSNTAKTAEGEEPFAYLETRPNFQDLVARRQEYLAWRKQQANATADPKT